MKRHAAVFALVLALAAGFGCTKHHEPSFDRVCESVPDDGGVQAAVNRIESGRVLFDLDRHRIKPEYKPVLAEKADLMKRHGNLRVRIEGNCDDRGGREYNYRLGERRARAAYEYLLANGVEPNRLEMVSYGKDNPAVEGRDEAARRQNRRDDFRVVAR